MSVLSLTHLRLDRPIVAVDTETTGLLPEARIVELALVRVEPGGKVCEWVQRVNPEVPIPPQASRVHGIRDHHVAGCRTIGAVAGEVLEFLEGCDLLGFNLLGFDLEVLDRELDRVDRRLDLDGVSLVDAMLVYHHHHDDYPRRLANAVRRYLGRDHTGAHGAGADARAALAVLDAQVEHHFGGSATVADLDCFPLAREAVLAGRSRCLWELDRRWVQRAVSDDPYDALLACFDPREGGRRRRADTLARMTGRDLDPAGVADALWSLRAAGWVREVDAGYWCLTGAGCDAVSDLVRSRWEEGTWPRSGSSQSPASPQAGPAVRP